MDVTLNAALQHWNNGVGVRQQRGGLLYIEIAGESVLEPVLRKGQSLFLRFEVVGRNFQPALAAAQLNVIARHLAQQCYQHITPAEFRGRNFGLSGLDRPAIAAEHINFPRGIESCLIDIVFEGNTRGHRERAENRLILALVLTCVGAAGIHRGPELRGGDAVERPGFAHARPGNSQIMVGIHGPLDERVQLRVVEALPPRREGRLQVRFAATQGRAPFRRRGGFRWLVIGANGATLEKSEGKGGGRGEDLRTVFHKLAIISLSDG